jgi:2-desacetyl-2-hydroxyethyl bacteriochlorophyllide A dehydrogenase
MKALVLTGPGQLSLREVPTPQFGEDELLVAIKYASMCSSDTKLIRGSFHGQKLPLIPGHEWCGVVADAPPRYRDWVGRKVVADILMPCLVCEHCRIGRRNLCTNLSESGITRDGGFAEYTTVKAVNVMALPDAMPLKHGCIVEPTAVAYNAIQRIGGVRPAERVLVLGSGVVGLIVMSLVRAMGPAELVAVDPIPARLEVAKACGVSRVLDITGPQLAALFDAGDLPRPDVVIDASDDPNSFSTALEVVKPGGRIGYITYVADMKATIMPSLMMIKALTIYGVLSPTETWPQAIEMVAKRVVDAERLVTHQFRLEQYEALLSLMNDRADGILRGAFVFGE